MSPVTSVVAQPSKSWTEVASTLYGSLEFVASSFM